MAIDADRMKAVFVTDEGLFGYNLDKGTLTELRLRRCEGSRIEIISGSINQEWLEASLMRCRQTH